MSEFIRGAVGGVIVTALLLVFLGGLYTATPSHNEGGWLFVTNRVTGSVELCWPAGCRPLPEIAPKPQP
jgi:hypothetical protein